MLQEVSDDKLLYGTTVSPWQRKGGSGGYLWNWVKTVATWAEGGGSVAYAPLVYSLLD